MWRWTTVHLLPFNLSDTRKKNAHRWKTKQELDISTEWVATLPQNLNYKKKSVCTYNKPWCNVLVLNESLKIQNSNDTGAHDYSQSHPTDWTAKITNSWIHTIGSEDPDQDERCFIEHPETGNEKKKWQVNVQAVLLTVLFENGGRAFV